MSELLNQYHFYLRSEEGYSVNTVKSYIYDLKLFFDHVKKDELQITADEIMKYFSDLNVMDLAKSSIARKRSSILSFYTFLEKNQFPIKVDTDRIVRIYHKYQYPNALPKEEMDDFLNSYPMDNSQNLRNKVIMEVLYTTGIRISELINLTIENLFFDAKHVLVIGKGNKYRHIPLSDYMIELLKLYIDKSRTELQTDKPSKILFLNRYGKKFSRMGLWKIIHKAAIEFGITKNFTPHTFRHSFATHMLAKGTNLRVIQILLGHASIATTQIYTKVDTTFLREQHSMFHPRSEFIE